MENNSSYFLLTPSWWHNITPIDTGREEVSPGRMIGPSIIHNYLLHYVHEGTGFLHKDKKTHKVKAGDLFVILPGEKTTYWASTTHPWTYSWINFSASETPNFLKEPVIRHPTVGRSFEKLWEPKYSENRQGMLFSLTYEILWKLSQNTTVPTKQENQYALYAKYYLENHYMDTLNIQSIADSLHINRRYLTDVFRKTYGMPPQAYLMQLRLNWAKEFLNQGYGVTESAIMAGFSDISNFSRQYKEHFGINPSKQKFVVNDE